MFLNLFSQFKQNESLKYELLRTAGTTLVSLEKNDLLLSAGPAGTDPYNPKTWKGKNILGYVLSEIRDEFLKSIHASIARDVLV